MMMMLLCVGIDFYMMLILFFGTLNTCHCGIDYFISNQQTVGDERDGMKFLLADVHQNITLLYCRAYTLRL